MCFQSLDPLVPALEQDALLRQDSINPRQLAIRGSQEMGTWVIGKGDWCDRGSVLAFEPCPVALVTWIDRAHPFVAGEPIAVSAMLPFGDSSSVVAPLGPPLIAIDSSTISPALYSLS